MIKAKSILGLAKLIYTFYLGSLFFVTLWPVWISLHLFPRNISIKICKIWAKLLVFFSFCSLQINTNKKASIKQPCIYIANHASYIDTILLASILPADTRFVSKKELFKVPIVKTFLNKLGHISVDRIDLQRSRNEVDYMIRCLKDNYSIFMFPEGTFTSEAGLRPFKLGAFKIAAEAGVPIYPIAIQGTRNVLRDKAFLMMPGRIKMTLLNPIYASGTSWKEVAKFKSLARFVMAKYCGETTLDMINAGSPEILFENPDL